MAVKKVSKTPKPAVTPFTQENLNKAVNSRPETMAEVTDRLMDGLAPALSGKAKQDPPGVKYTDKQLGHILSKEGLPRKELSGGITPEGAEERSRATAEDVAYRRAQVQRLLLRGVPHKTISSYLHVSPQTLCADIKAIKESVRDEVLQLDFPTFVGETLAFYQEVRNISLRMATDKEEKDKRLIMLALNTSISAENAKHRFLSEAGLYTQAAKSPAFAKAVGVSRESEFSEEFHSFITALPTLLEGTNEL